MYRLVISKSAEKELSKLDPQTLRIIKNWILKNLVNVIDPRIHGKALTGNLKGIWRYRVGDYRLFVEIKDKEMSLFLFHVAHRREAYQNQMA